MQLDARGGELARVAEVSRPGSVEPTTETTAAEPPAAVEPVGQPAVETPAAGDEKIDVGGGPGRRAKALVEGDPADDLDWRELITTVDIDEATEAEVAEGLSLLERQRKAAHDYAAGPCW